MGQIMNGQASPPQIACLLTALRMKGETIDEITGFAEKMRENAVHIKPIKSPLIDTCGTGGDVSHTFNISTIAAFVAAGAGIAVAKHGNRSVSSKCGSADLLEAFGAKIETPPKKVESAINQVGFGFIFAPQFHPAMKYAAPVRKELGIRTVFNILGPLCNPANAQAQLLGVFSPSLVETMAAVLLRLGVKSALVVHGNDGLDEISICDKTQAAELKNGKIIKYCIDPEKLGIKKASHADLATNCVDSNRQITEEILSGKLIGPKRDIVLLNSAAAIYISGKSKDLGSGLKIAADSIDSGAAWERLQAYIEFTKKES